MVIVGGSLAGASAARSLRRQGFSGEVPRRPPRDVNSPRDCRPLRDLVQRGAPFESVATAAALRGRPAAERET